MNERKTPAQGAIEIQTIGVIHLNKTKAEQVNKNEIYNLPVATDNENDAARARSAVVTRSGGFRYRHITGILLLVAPFTPTRPSSMPSTILELTRPSLFS